MQKTCKVCNEKKDLSLFRADSHLPDGRRNHCKLCRNRKLKSKNGGNVFLRTHISEVESFEQKFIPEPNSGCWLWEMPDKNGKYGSFTFNKIRRSAHRASWEIYIGIPMCHECHAEQHRIGEEKFFGDIQKPIELSNALWLMTGDLERCKDRVTQFRRSIRT